jgi:hypothetical protein
MRVANSRLNRARSSRQRYRLFVEDYKQRRLDEKAEAENQKHRRSNLLLDVSRNRSRL